MIVTVDGPAGAGKSSVSRQLAERLGFRFLDTGAMYRAVTLAALRRGVPLTDPVALERVAAEVAIRLEEGCVFLDGEEVTAAIRTADVTANVRHAADSPGVRRQLIRLQQAEATRGDLVSDGRDQGTLAFPQAEVKFFLTATAGERARRRQEELKARGTPLPLEQVLAEQTERDRQDAEREFGRLVPAEDAVVLVTDGLSIDEVVDEMEGIVRRRKERRQ